MYTERRDVKRIFCCVGLKVWIAPSVVDSVHTVNSVSKISHEEGGNVVGATTGYLQCLLGSYYWRQPFMELNIEMN